MKRNIDFKFILMLFFLCFYFVVNSSPNISYVRAMQRIQNLCNTGVKQYAEISNSVSKFFAEKKTRREASIEWYQSKIFVTEALKKAIQVDPKNAEIIRWHDEEVKNFNIAIMRNTHGMQYKGAEVSMKSLNQ